MTTLSGRVTAHGHPAAGAVVELHNAAGDVVDEVMVDDDGRYSYHVSPAKWSVKVWDRAGHTGSANAEVAEGEDKVLDVALGEPEGGH